MYSVLSVKSIKSTTKASRGGLANRQLPSSTTSSSKKSLSNSSSDCGLDGSDDDEREMHNSNNVIDRGTNSNNINIGVMGIGVNIDTSISNGNHPTNGHHNSIIINQNDKYVREQQINQLYAQVHKDHKAHTTIPNIFKNDETLLSSLSGINMMGVTGGSGGVGGMSSFGGSKDLTSSYDSIIGSNDKLSENDQTENWMYPSRRRGVPNSGKVPPISFSDQLNQALSDRER